MNRYHIRRREKEISSGEEIRGILTAGKFASIALCRDGEPYIVTMNYGYVEAEDALYFHCAREGEKIEFLMSTGSACATVVEDLGYRHGECDHAYRSVVLRGRISIVEDLEGKKRGLGVLLEHLENDPQPIRRRSLPDDASYDKVCILRFDISGMTGKQG
jgi:nitroimidazol reductase NimA-like FMN-containing flavoprotein (pyridoxamine 5'-phosphate oxidase superfamily)